MFKRKFFAALLALLLVLSLVPTVFVPKTAVAEDTPVDQAIVQGGAILHCFDWSYNEIRAALPDIAAAGYAAVQTSPVQPPKDYNASWNDTGGNWWKLYQPLDFCVADEGRTWLGSKAELTALCDEAEDLGIYVIVDVVANHTANKTGGGYTVNGTYNVSEQVADRLQDPDGSKGLYHTSENSTNDGSRYNMTQYHLSMPDLNTGNRAVQDMVLEFLEECVDCGVDGFRFDAAKHIELPNDSGCSSDFWPYVLSGVRDYAGAENLYIYGESLSGSGTDAWVNEFITYMGLTDSQTGNTARDAVNGQNAGLLAVSDYTRGNSPKDYVIWAESHDTYEDGGSTGVSSDKIVKTWAIVGARADSTALFLARPNERMGIASSDTSWKSPAVAAVNKFKAHYDGTGEWLSYDQDAKITYIERGTSGGDAGVSIVKLEGAGWVDLEAHLMSDGVYKDSITGNTFGVQNGRIFGNVGPTGVAVVYETSTGSLPTPPVSTTRTLYFRPNSNWKQDGARFAMYSWGSGQHWTGMTRVDGETEDIYEADLPSGDTSVIFCRMNPASAENNWNNKWNQTGDLAVQSDKNLFTLAEGVWDGATTTWGVYGDVGGGEDPTPVNEDEGYYLVGTMTGWSVMPGFRMTRIGAQNVEEYSIDVPLMRTSKPYHSQFKVVYSPNGITDQTWFPGGFDNNYGDYAGEIPQSGVYTVYFRPNYDGGSDWHDNCIYAERTKYFVTVNDADKNGTVTVDKDIAAAGDTVTVTVTPNEGYELDTLVYMCETGFNTGEFTTTEITGTTFTMPAENAAVRATFVQDGALSDGYYLVPDADPTIENINPAHKLTLFTDLDPEGHVFNYFTNYAVTGNFGENTYRIVKVEGNAIVPFDLDQPALTVTTTGVTETVYLATEPAGQYTWIYDYGSGVSSLSGYYLNIGSSPVPNITADYAFEETDTAGLYLFEGVLYHSDIFVCKLENGRCTARYPAGSYMDTTEVAQNLDGTPFGWGSFDRLVRVSFRPDGQGTPAGTEYMGDYGKWFHGYFLSEVLNRVIINESEHGTVTADKMTAEEGETVTLTITPDPGYELDTLTVVNDYNEPVEVTDNAFEMTIWEAKVTATFREAEKVYVVILDPGEGTGDQIVYRSDDENAFAESWRDKENCKFYIDDDGSIGFYLEEHYCPDTFSGPDERDAFERWSTYSWIRLTDTQTVITARWIPGPASYTLSPTSYTLTENGVNTIPCTLDDLYLGTFEVQLESMEGYITRKDQARSLCIRYNYGTLSDGDGHSIPFKVGNQPGDLAYTQEFTQAGSAFNMTVNIDSNAMADAVPGTYTGELFYTGLWTTFNFGMEFEGDSGTIALTLIVPENTAKPFNGTVAFNEGEVKYKGTTPYVVWNYDKHEPAFTVYDEDGETVIDPENYEFEYRENEAPGTGYLFLTFKNAYSGEARAFFKIYLPATTATTVENVSNGIKLTWAPVEDAAGYVIYRRAWSSTTGGWTDFVRWNNTTELEWLDETVYAGTRYQYGIKAYFTRRTDPVTGAQIGGNVGDNFNLGEVGPLKTTVRITTRTLNSVTAGTTQMTVKWTPTKNFTGIQVQYATNAAFTQNSKNYKIEYQTDANGNVITVSQDVIKDLTSGKTYYVRIRSYHFFEGMNYYGEWSNVLSAKVGKPTITTQPKAQSVTAGKTVTFTVAAEGTGLSYQWQWSSDGTTWTNCKSTGYNTASFSFKATATLNGRQYRCVVKNSYGSVTSKAAKLTVK